jgi:hypothetical protein
MPKKQHGLSTSKIYSIWRAMLDRCNNKFNPRYKHYGGRGIKICQRWLNFENFYSDMGDIPEGMSLGRKNNNSNYSPENCEWEDKFEQANNTSRNVFITFKGETKTITQWAKKININPVTLSYRIKKWSIEKAFNYPHKIGFNGRENHICFSGKTLNLKEWSKELNIPYNCLFYRIKSNWPIERAFTEPIGAFFSK